MKNLNPIFVLEGPDCAGKSTLGEFLRKKWSAHLMHQTYRFTNQMFTYHTAVITEAMKRAENQVVIIDRWWPSELIYAEAFRGGSKWPMGGRMLDRVGIKQGVIYVSCLPSDQSAHQAIFARRAADGGELFDTVNKVVELYEGWDKRMSHRYDFIRYDMFTDGKDMSVFAYELEELWTKLHADIPDWWKDPDETLFAGQVNQPWAMVIGEKSNPKGRHKLWPFFEHDNSSLWITTAIAVAGVKEERLNWVNAVDDQDWAQVGMLKAIAAQTKPRYVISLGKTADKVALAAGLHQHPGYGQLKHPAYYKRFENGDMSPVIGLFTQIRENCDEVPAISK